MTTLRDLRVARAIEAIGCGGTGCDGCVHNHAGADPQGCVLPAGYDLVRDAIGVAAALNLRTGPIIQQILDEEELEDEDGRAYLSGDALRPLAAAFATLAAVLGQQTNRRDELPPDLAAAVDAQAPGVLTLTEDGGLRSALLLRGRLDDGVQFLQRAARADVILWIEDAA